MQKVLARAGYGSRREIERLIEAGRLEVNGRVATLGESVTPADEIALDGKRLPVSVDRDAPRRVLIYHKPEGEICTRSDPEGRQTVFERLPKLRTSRWISIGRLDINSAGLLLLTTDGELAHRLMHPSTGIEREYAVRVLGTVTDEQLTRLREGVELEDGPARFIDIADAGGQGANRWYHVIIAEGRHREVRRLWESQDLTVSRLIRVRYGPVSLPRGLRPGKWAELDEDQLSALCIAAGLVKPPEKAPAKRQRKTAGQRGAGARRKPRTKSR
ncbi:MAG: 23S rRNA pseudouridine synthase [Gammaproteobacteria bacterium]|nr:MAG: 23S rRNA pseudouridine synthase [Gammaproteobacteria bacterium]TND06835.1 MAG: 23S rRNA pseudouridine synthase [Gammaproteobacteria bacterium]